MRSVGMMAVIAAVAAITAGLLALAGVGDNDSRSQREAQAREQRIDRAAQRLAADVVQEVPEICEEIDRSISGVDETSMAVAVDDSYFSELTAADRDEFAARSMSELKRRCEERNP